MSRGFSSTEPTRTLVPTNAEAERQTGSLPLGVSELYARHVDFVARSLRGLRLPEELLDDAVQDVFLVVHRRFADFEARSSVRTWLFGIALRVAQGHRRTLRRRRALLDQFSTMLQLAPAGVPDPEAQLTRRQASRLLHALIRQLDDEKRAILVAVELEDMTVPDAALALNWKRGTAYTRLRAARKAFRRVANRQTTLTPSGPRLDDWRTLRT